MEFGIATVVTVTVIVYIIALGIRATKLDNKWIPAICGMLGICIGIAAYYIGVPDFPAVDPLTAAAVGGASGLAATGVDQLIKQMKS